jgi:ubiquinone biosynthesis protein
LFGSGITHRDLTRYRQIIGVLVRYGFGDLVSRAQSRYFLRLPIRQIRNRVTKLSHLTTAERMRLAFEDLGPTFIKLGQILSCRPDLLPPSFLKEMSRLQDDVPPFPYQDAKLLIESQLGRPLEELFLSIESEPVAAASLASVYRAVINTGEEVAIKVQRPGVDKVLEADIRILKELAQLAEHHMLEARSYEPTRIVDEFARTVRREIDFVREGRNIERFRKYFAHDKTVHIPRVFWEYTASKVLTTEYISGIKISDLEGLDAAGLDRKAIALNGANLTLKEVFEFHFFHADPHPGNLFVLTNAVIAPVDFGMTGTIDEEVAANMSALFTAVLNRDVNTLIDILLSMGVASEPIDRKGLKAEIVDLLDQYHGVPLKEVNVGKAIEEHMRIIRRYRLRPPADLVIMARALLVSEGVARMLYPEFNIVEYARPFARKVITQGLDPTKELYELARTSRDALRLAKRLPSDGQHLLNKMMKDEFRIGLDHKGLDRFITELDRSSNRLSFAVVIAALIVGSSVVFRAGTGPTLFGYPMLGLAGFLMASVLGLWLLVGIIRSGRL